MVQSASYRNLEPKLVCQQSPIAPNGKSFIRPPTFNHYSACLYLRTFLLLLWTTHAGSNALQPTCMLTSLSLVP
jgi:hypothetical protein